MLCGGTLPPQAGLGCAGRTGVCWGLIGTCVVWSWAPRPARDSVEACDEVVREAFEGLGFQARPGRAQVSFLPATLCLS